MLSSNVLRRSARLIAIGSLSSVPATLAAQVSEEQQEAVLIYECGKSMVWAEAYSDEVLRVTSDEVWAHFDQFAASHTISEAKAAIALDAYWQEIYDEDGAEELTSMIMMAALSCEDKYLKRREQVTAASEGNHLVRELSVEQLQSLFERTGDASSVADYIVYQMPNGKDPFADSPRGELLGRLVVDAGADGIRRFSDAAILAMVGARYWQYNPPATRLVDAEYRRRLRARNYSEAQGRSWTQRAAADRAEQARLANAKPVGSIGKHCNKYLEPAGPGTPAAWVTKCSSR
jgi:hypothetical protein